MATVTIKPGAVTDDAERIDKIISDIKADMEELDGAIKRNIPSRVETEWSRDVKDKWDKYYSAEIPEAMDNMKDSATNLRLAVDEKLRYSRGE